MPPFIVSDTWYGGFIEKRTPPDCYLREWMNHIPFLGGSSHGYVSFPQTPRFTTRLHHRRQAAGRTPPTRSEGRTRALRHRLLRLRQTTLCGSPLRLWRRKGEEK